jgi:hypothetical protein
MEITHPTQAPPTTTPAPAGVKSTQPLDSIPEEDEAQAQQGSNPEGAAEAADRADDSAALSVGCALLLQLGLEEMSASDNVDDASTGACLCKSVAVFSVLLCDFIQQRTVWMLLPATPGVEDINVHRRDIKICCRLNF